MNTLWLSLLVSSVLVVPLALVVGAAGRASAQPPEGTFGAHASSCAHTPTSNGATARTSRATTSATPPTTWSAWS